MPTDPSLLFQSFVDERPRLAAYAFILLEDWELVEEALQEVAVYVGERGAEFAPGSNFIAWARAVTKLRALEVLARRRRSRRGQPLAVLHDAVEPTAAPGAWDERHRAALDECLSLLPPQHRRLLALRYGQDHSGEDLSSALGRTVESVYMQLSRLRSRLRACVEGRLASVGRA